MSIIINNYNYASYVESAILSALSQIYNPTEVIVVDDGSTDNSLEIIGRYCDRVTIIQKPNAGQASAFNAGIAEANGRFIILLDADDVLFPSAAARGVQSLREGYSRVYFRAQAIDQRGERSPHDDEKIPFVDFDGDAIEAAARGERFPATVTSANFFDAIALKRVTPIPERDWKICADNYVSIQTSAFGFVRSIDEAVAGYRIHGNNSWMTASNIFVDRARIGVFIDNHLRGVELIDACCRKRGIPVAVKEERSFWVLHLLCAARAIHAMPPPMRLPSRLSLGAAVLDYALHGFGSLAKRLANSIYLLAVLMLPEAAAKRLLEWRTGS